MTFVFENTEGDEVTIRLPPGRLVVTKGLEFSREGAADAINWAKSEGAEIEIRRRGRKERLARWLTEQPIIHPLGRVIRW